MARDMICVHAEDKRVFVAAARKRGYRITEYMHLLAERLKENDPSLVPAPSGEMSIEEQARDLADSLGIS